MFDTTATGTKDNNYPIKVDSTEYVSRALYFGVKTVPGDKYY